jgi:hypothetical protein
MPTQGDSLAKRWTIVERILSFSAGSLLSKISRTAFSGSYGYLRARWRAATGKQVLFREADALLDFLRRTGCSFHRCADLYPNPVPHGIAYRYDVHVRDIPGCHAFMEFHARRQLPATFFLLWDYSPAERSRGADFLHLRDRVDGPLEIGLHASPVDAFLIWNKFGGDRRAYAKWAASQDVLSWLGSFARRPEELDDFNRAVLHDFVERVERTKTQLGPVSLVAGHGGELGQSLRKKMARFRPAVREVALNLRARHWLTPDRLAAAGLLACVDRNNHSSDGWFEASDDGGMITKMARVLGRRLDDAAAVQLLLHPYTWAGGKRDAELSSVLNATVPASPPSRPAAGPVVAGA